MADRRLALLATAAAVAMVVVSAGCGSLAQPQAAPTSFHESFTFGRPAISADADRTVDVIATDPFTFEPATISITRGETVTFAVTNLDTVAHEFVIGDRRAQAEHADLPAHDGDADEHGALNAISVPAGQSATLTWAFTETTDVAFACLEPGHLEAGMHGRFRVDG